MVLEAVKPRQEHDAGLVKLGGGPEDQPGERDGRVESRAEAFCIAFSQFRECQGGSWGQWVKNTKQGMRIADLVALYQLGIIEIIPRVHFDTIRQEAAHGDFL